MKVKVRVKMVEQCMGRNWVKRPHSIDSNDGVEDRPWGPHAEFYTIWNRHKEYKRTRGIGNVWWGTGNGWGVGEYWRRCLTKEGMIQMETRCVGTCTALFTCALVIVCSNYAETKKILWAWLCMCVHIHIYTPIIIRECVYTRVW